MWMLSSTTVSCSAQAAELPRPMLSCRGAGARARNSCLPCFRADLKEVGPEGQDPFGNFAIDVNTLGAFPGVPQFPAAAAATECTQQPTTLTTDFGAATLGPASEAAKPSKAAGQRKASQGKQQHGSGKEPLDAKTVRKQLALQEKNRRAQRRFRERQKQKVR